MWVLFLFPFYSVIEILMEAASVIHLKVRNELCNCIFEVLLPQWHPQLLPAEEKEYQPKPCGNSGEFSVQWTWETVATHCPQLTLVIVCQHRIFGKLKALTKKVKLLPQCATLNRVLQNILPSFCRMNINSMPVLSLTRMQAQNLKNLLVSCTRVA